MKRVACILIVFATVTVVGCRQDADRSNGPASIKDRACTVTDAFPGSANDPTELGRLATEAVESLPAFPERDRQVVMHLGAVAEAASNAAAIREKAGDGWQQTIAGGNTLERLQKAQAALTADCA